MADVFLTPEAQKDVTRLPLGIRARMAKVFVRLAAWPDVSGAKPLTGNLAGRYRIRTGDYRIRFRVEGARVIIERIGHRKDVYEE